MGWVCQIPQVSPTYKIGTPFRSGVVDSRDDEKMFAGYSLARSAILQQNRKLPHI